MNPKENQILFKYFQDEEFETETIKQPLQLEKIIVLNQELHIFELIIENCRTFVLNSYHSNLLEQLQQLVYLGLNGCQIKSLLHLPLIDSLKRLTLDNNQLEDDQLKYLSYYANKLCSLSLINNYLKFNSNSQALQHLCALQQLVQLSIVGNQFQGTPEKVQLEFENVQYISLRQQIFILLPNLLFLDCIKRDQTINYIKDFRNQKEEDLYLSQFSSHSETKSNNNSRSSSIHCKVEQMRQQELVEKQISDESMVEFSSRRQLRKQQRKFYGVE